MGPSDGLDRGLRGVSGYKRNSMRTMLPSRGRVRGPQCGCSLKRDMARWEVW
jgi:hypothetical protein